MTKVTNLLFICSKNQSAGTSPNAKKVVSQADIRWADFIFVMEDKHKNRVLAKFTKLLGYKKIYVLEIPDNYKYMDSELVREVTEKVATFMNV
jgi:predicted protein tyrosine phosphatase